MFQQPKVDFSKYSSYTESMNTLYEPASEPEHPGRYLKTLISADETKKSFAARLGVSKQTLFELLGERQPLSPPWLPAWRVLRRCLFWIGYSAKPLLMLMNWRRRSRHNS